MNGPIMLQAGLLQAEFDNGGLRAIAYNGIEIVRGIYAAVRDQDWGTVAPLLSDLAISQDVGKSITRFTCRHIKDEIDFEWEGDIELASDGIRFDFKGRARSTFLKNRIGFCILHPMNFVGLPIEISSTAGSIKGSFPQAISPHQPYKSMKGIKYEPSPGLQVEISFIGELFEMEDQRNWTDASYKTYCTPLEQAYPVLVEAGERVEQSIWIRIEDVRLEEGRPRYSSHDRSVMNHSESGLRSEVIVVSDSIAGTMPGIGYGVNADDSNPTTERWIRQLRPSHLRLTIDLADERWLPQLEEAGRTAGLLGCGVELEVLLDADGIRLTDLIRRISSSNSPIPIVRLLPYAADSFVVDEETLDSVNRIVLDSALTIPAGGGSRAYYAEFNRAALPFDDMAFASYSINPQVHAFDDRSLLETLAAQRVAALDAAAKSGLPLHIGPITFKPRINPNATGGSADIPIADQHDSRQMTLFGAVWTLGSLAALCLPEVKGLTYYELTGPLGLVRDGVPSPLYFVLRDATEEQDAVALRVDGSSDRLAALALRLPDGRMRLLLGNLTSETLEVEVDGGIYVQPDITMYDEETIALHQSVNFPGAEGRGLNDSQMRIWLKPYACAKLDYARGKL